MDTFFDVEDVTISVDVARFTAHREGEVGRRSVVYFMSDVQYYEVLRKEN